MFYFFQRYKNFAIFIIFIALFNKKKDFLLSKKSFFLNTYVVEGYFSLEYANLPSMSAML